MVNATDLGAEMDFGSHRLVQLKEIGRDWRRDGAAHQAIGDLDDIDVNALLAQAGGDLQSDEAAADDRRVLHRRKPRKDAPRVGKGAELEDIGVIRARDRKPAVAGAERERQVIVGKRLAVIEAHQLRRPVDRDGAAATEQCDAVLGVEDLRLQHQRVAAVALEEVLGERRLLVGQVALVVDEDDRSGKACLAERVRELHASVTRADDDHSFHVNDPLSCGCR